MPKDVLILVNHPALAQPLEKELFHHQLFSLTLSRLSSQTPPAAYLIVLASEKPSLADHALTYLEKYPSTKTIFVFSINEINYPNHATFEKINALQSRNKNIKIIFTGDLLAEDYSQPFPFAAALDLYLTSVSDLAKPLLHDLFSYTHTNHSLYASKISFPAPASNKSLKAKLPQYLVQDKNLISLPTSEAVLLHLSQSRLQTPSRSLLHFSFSRKSLLFSFLLLFWAIILPFVLLFISSTSLILAAKSARQANFKLAHVLSQASSSFAELGETGFQIQSQVPLLKTFSPPGLAASRLLTASSRLALRLTKLSQTGQPLFLSLTPNTDFDLPAFSEKLYLELDLLYKESSFLEANFRNIPLLTTLFPQLSNFHEYRQYLYSARQVATALPTLLGSEKPVTYLILFQNNMELRPTGGFIGSFALPSFQNGQLIDFPVYDVYSADGQLKGYVSPPDPIVNYLGEESWYLRDSNWDPDFSVSAQRAEWFLDKTLDRRVEGVIALDLNLLRDLLEITGPVKLPDFNDEITSRNFYQKIQYEVEADFFPGSRKKANYLGSLTTTLLDRLSHLNSPSQLQVAHVLFKNLNSKSIQVYLHDQKTQSVASVLGWSGEVTPATCQGNCHTFWLGLAEANLGVNKANLYINRSAQLILDFQKDTVENHLTLTYVNVSTETDKVPEYRYKNYLRFLLPVNAAVESLTTSQNGHTFTHDPDITLLSNYQEVGLLLDLPPASEMKVDFTWREPPSLDLAAPHGQVLLNWRQQAGVSTLPATILLQFSAHPSLTNGKLVRYNTDLSQDFKEIFSW